MSKTNKKPRTKPKRKARKDVEPVVCRICNGTREINGDPCARCDGEGYEYIG